MDRHAGAMRVSGILLGAALWLLNGCVEAGTIVRIVGDPSGRYGTSSAPSVRSGTRINVALGGSISSETATIGDPWHGTVTENVMARNEDVIPPGSEVDGVVTGVTPATPGSPAMLELGVRTIRVEGQSAPIIASAEPVVAGSPRARNLGAIAGGAAVGALIGVALGYDRMAGVAGTVPGSSLVLADGTVMSFTVRHTVAMR